MEGQSEESKNAKLNPQETLQFEEAIQDFKDGLDKKAWGVSEPNEREKLFPNKA